jgi:hypothetical protein
MRRGADLLVAPQAHDIGAPVLARTDTGIAVAFVGAGDAPHVALMNDQGTAMTLAPQVFAGRVDRSRDPALTFGGDSLWLSWADVRDAAPTSGLYLRRITLP